MIAQTTITLPQPVTLDLRQSTGPRPRVVSAAVTLGPLPDDPEHEPVWQEFTEFPMWLTLDANAREIRAQLPPLPRMLPLFGPADFAAAAADTMEDHAARVLQLLGSDPANVLQALCDGTELPPMPPRVPREIANWRARAVLELAGLLPTVEATISGIEGQAGTVVRNAWQSGAPLARHGPTVSALAPALGLTEAQVDAMFIQAEALSV
jgi:hypothetical protein